MPAKNNLSDKQRKEKMFHDCKTIARKNGGKCLSSQYVNSHTHLLWQCSKGHKWKASPINIKRGTWCPNCSGKVITWENILAASLRVNARPLFKFSDYKNNSTKYPFVCLTCRNQWSATLGSIKSLRSCPKCAKSKGIEKRIARHHSLDELQTQAKKLGGDCLSEKYLGVDKKHLFKCEQGHKWETIAYNIFKNKSWCPICAGRYNKLPEMTELAKSRGGYLLTKKYHGMNYKYLWKCNLGHQFAKTYNKVKQGQWCTYCSTNISEQICRYAMEHIFKCKFPTAHPKFMNGLELDGYSEKLKIAFEHQGYQHTQKSHWHRSILQLKEQEKRDKLKRSLCRKHKIQLIEFPQLNVDLKTQDVEGYIFEWIKNNKIDVKLNHKPLDLNKAYILTDKIKEHNLLIKKRSLECLSTSYLGVDHNHLYKCHKCGNKFKATFYNIQSGSGCKFCKLGMLGTNTKKTMSQLIKEANIVGLQPQFTYEKYTRNDVPHLYKCLNCNKTVLKAPSSIQQKKGCSFCSLASQRKKLIKNKLFELQKTAESLYGKCLSKEYFGIDYKYDFKCKYGHTWSASAYNILNRNSWCPICRRKKSK